jgi:hypothetical protein
MGKMGKVVEKFRSEKLKEGGHFEELSVRINMDIGEVRCKGVNWLQLTQEQIRQRDDVVTDMKLHVPQGTLLSSPAVTISFSRKL